MSYSVTNLKSDLSGILHGTRTSQITGLDNLIYRAGRQVLEDIDPQETKRYATLPQVFSDVYDYAAPSDLKGNKVIDIFVQANRYPGDMMQQKYNRDFDKDKSFQLSQNFTIKFNSGAKSLRISNPRLNEGVVLSMAESTTGNGTWAASGDASTLTDDNIYFVDGAGSLKFNLATSGSSGVLTNSTLNALDLTDYQNQAYLFLYTYLPTGSDFTSVTLKWGTDASNYWSLAATTTQEGLAFQNGWNLLSYAWASATQTGTPTITDIGYLEVTWAYNGTAQTAVRLNDIRCVNGTIMNIEYYSKFLFRNASTSAWQETILDDSDIINLDTESYNILLAKVAIYAAQQAQGSIATSFDYPFWTNEYDKSVKRYKEMYKSEIQKPQSTYYQQPKPGYQRFWNRRNY